MMMMMMTWSAVPRPPVPGPVHGGSNLCAGSNTFI
jgi:hypothetical protein